MTHRLKIALSTVDQRQEIDRIRHDVYATELEQFPSRPDRMLHDRPNVESIYITAVDDGMLIGFIGITPPSSSHYSVDHYLSRSDLPITFDNQLYEIRALTVIAPERGSLAAPALMYAAFRWIQTRGGTQLMAIGHEAVLDMYLRVGMQRTGQSFSCGQLKYKLLTASVSSINEKLSRSASRLRQLEKRLEWKMDSPFQRSADCYHGGAFFSAIGNQFDDLSRQNEIISADVLDAWFSPCPSSRKALQEHLDWIMRTSPPTHSEGLAQTIARTRGVSIENILTGGGSSPLIFLAFRQWLTPASRVLLLDPTYGEYAHVLEKVVGCKVDRVKLHRNEGYVLKPERIAFRLQDGYDLFVWVNPNSPTGQHTPRAEAEAVLQSCPSTTRVWIDETYVDYAGRKQSLESFATQSANTVVCKSMSKVYSLSGLRVGYLCGPPGLMEPLRALTPPWSVSLPAQIAAVHALNSPDYYETRYKETQQLRTQLVQGLQQMGIVEIISGMANFILFHLRDDHPDAATVIQRCRKKGLFLRDAAEMGSGLGDRAVRIAVKDENSNLRMLAILENSLITIRCSTPCHH